MQKKKKKTNCTLVQKSHFIQYFYISMQKGHNWKNQSCKVIAEKPSAGVIIFRP